MIFSGRTLWAPQNGKKQESWEKWEFRQIVLCVHVSCSCSHFSTPRQPHFRPRAGPGPAPAGARECVFPTWVRTPAPARARAQTRRTRARSVNPVFAVAGEEEEEEEEGFPYPLSLWNLSKENSIPTYQRYVGMLKTILICPVIN